MPFIGECVIEEDTRMNEESVTVLKSIGIRILEKAIELEEKACNETDQEEQLKYSYMSDGLMIAVREIEEKIKEVLKENEPTGNERKN